MSRYRAQRIEATEIAWPEPSAIAAERVLGGAPVAATVVLEESPTHQLGFWRVTTGEFITDHAGYVEFIHILSGSGSLVSDDGETIPLSAGVTVHLAPGWTGRWVVEETITKVFTIIAV